MDDCPESRAVELAKLGNYEDYDSPYQDITALEGVHHTLRMEGRPNLQVKYVLTPKNEDSMALLRNIAEEVNKVLLIDPTEGAVGWCLNDTH